MAKLTLNPLCDLASGKIKCNGNQSYRVCGGQQFTYNWDPDTIIKATPARLIQRQAMKQANLDAATIMANPEKKAEWQLRFEQQHKYKNFRPFIVATRMAEIKSFLQSLEP